MMRDGPDGPTTAQALKIPFGQPSVGSTPTSGTKVLKRLTRSARLLLGPQKPPTVRDRPTFLLPGGEPPSDSPRGFRVNLLRDVGVS